MKRQLPLFDDKERLLCTAFLLCQLFAIPFALSIFCIIFGVSLSVSLQNIICFALNFICAILFFPNYWLQHLRNLSGKSHSILRTAATYFGIYYVATVLINLLVYNIAPDFSNANDSAISKMASESRILMSFSLVVLVPPAEELLFRGIVFGRIYNRHPFIAYLTSILTFSAIHVVGYIGSASPGYLLLSLLQYIPASICLARAYEETGNLFTSILIHSVINFIGVLSM